MEKVTNKVFYHINSKSNQNPYNLLSKGDVIKVGEKFNPFMGSYNDRVPPIDNDYNALVNAITFYWHYTRESIFEEVRKNVDKDLPSRFKCLWVGEYNQISNWEPHFNRSEYQILELLLTGIIFKCDASFIEGNPMPLSQLRDRAKNYWGGKIVNSHKIECLFIGEAKVKNIL